MTAGAAGWLQGEDRHRHRCWDTHTHTHTHTQTWWIEVVDKSHYRRAFRGPHIQYCRLKLWRDACLQSHSGTYSAVLTWNRAETSSHYNTDVFIQVIFKKIHVLCLLFSLSHVTICYLVHFIFLSTMWKCNIFVFWTIDERKQVI